MTDTRLSEPNDYNNFSLWLNGQSFDETRDCYPYSRQKKYMPEAVTVSVYPVRWPMWPPEMLLKIRNS
jgi:hypothetical protein